MDEHLAGSKEVNCDCLQAGFTTIAVWHLPCDAREIYSRALCKIPYDSVNDRHGIS